MRIRTYLMISGALAVLVPLAACGGSSNSSGTTASSDSGAVTTTSESLATTTVDIEPRDSDYCSKIKEYNARADELDSSMSSTNVADVKAAFESIQVMIHDLDKNPPSEIAEAVHTMREASDQLIAVFGKYDYDFTKLAGAPEYVKLAETMDSNAINEANEKLDNYSTSVCGLPPDTTLAS